MANPDLIAQAAAANPAPDPIDPLSVDCPVCFVSIGKPCELPAFGEYAPHSRLADNASHPERYEFAATDRAMALGIMGGGPDIRQNILNTGDV